MAFFLYSIIFNIIIIVSICSHLAASQRKTKKTFLFSFYKCCLVIENSLSNIVCYQRCMRGVNESYYLLEHFLNSDSSRQMVFICHPRGFKTFFNKITHITDDYLLFTPSIANDMLRYLSKNPDISFHGDDFYVFFFYTNAFLSSLFLNMRHPKLPTLARKCKL